MTRRLVWLAVTLTLAIALGCASDSTSTRGGACTAESCPDGECIDDRCVRADVEPAPTPDASTDPSSPDVGSDDTEPPTPGAFGEPCELDRECISGWCIDSGDGSKICTRYCTDRCDEGFDCRLVTSSGGDAARICVPSPRSLCQNCRTDAQCAVGSRCLQQENGRFCATPCGPARSCPGQFTCANVTIPGAGGASTTNELCVPSTGECAPVDEIGGFGVIPAHFRSDSFRMTGRIHAAPHVATGETLQLTSGP